MNHQRDLC